eukprot:UN11623
MSSIANKLKSLGKPLRLLHSNYLKISSNKPYFTAMVTGGSILTISDCTAQLITSKFRDNYKFDWRRTLALCTFGTFYYGLIARKIYFVYELLLGPSKPILKAFIDCAIHPIIFIPFFYFITGTVKGQTPKQITLQLNNEWYTCYTAFFAYWLPMMWFNFKYCTPETRIFFIATMSFLQNSALSWYSNRNRVKQRSIGNCEIQKE